MNFQEVIGVGEGVGNDENGFNTAARALTNVSPVILAPPDSTGSNPNCVSLPQPLRNCDQPARAMASISPACAAIAVCSIGARLRPQRVRPAFRRSLRVACAHESTSTKGPRASAIPGPEEDREVAHEAFLHAFQESQPERARVPGMQEFASALLSRSRIPSQQYSDPLKHIFDVSRRGGWPASSGGSHPAIPSLPLPYTHHHALSLHNSAGI